MPFALLLAALAGIPNPPEACGQVNTSWDVPGIAEDLREEMEAYRGAWKAWCQGGGSLAPIVARAFHLEHKMGRALFEGRGPTRPEGLDGEDQDEAVARMMASPLPAFRDRATVEAGHGVYVDWDVFRRLARATIAEDRRFLDAWSKLWELDSGGWTWAGTPAESDNTGGCLLLGDHDLAADYERARGLEVSQKHYRALLDLYVGQTSEALDMVVSGSFPGCRFNDRAVSHLEKLAKVAGKRDPGLAQSARSAAEAVRSRTAKWTDAP